MQFLLNPCSHETPNRDHSRKMDAAPGTLRRSATVLAMWLGPGTQKCCRSRCCGSHRRGLDRTRDRHGRTCEMESVEWTAGLPAMCPASLLRQDIGRFD